MHKYLKKLIDERNTLTGLMQSATEKAAGEDRELSEAEAQRLRDWQERAAQIDREAGEQAEYLESQRAWARLQETLTAANQDDDRLVMAGRQAGGLQTRNAPASWGEAFTSAPGFQRYNGHGSSEPVQVSGLWERAPIDTQWMTVPPAPFVPTPWVMTTPLLDAVGRQKVSTGSVQWITYPGSYPLAGEVPEGTLKPEAAFAPTENEAALKTFAHWVAITRQALEDIPRIQSIIESQLRNGILRKLEDTTAGVLNAETGFAGVTDPDLLTGIRIALGTVQDAGYATANVVLLNPADWAALDIGVMGNTQNGPVGTASFWGLRPVSASAVAEGTAYVGDFQTGVTMFDRGQTSVYMTDSHADYFLRNQLVVLAESRNLPVVTQTQAIVKVTVGTAP